MPKIMDAREDVETKGAIGARFTDYLRQAAILPEKYALVTRRAEASVCRLRASQPGV
jgi:hypothetical protein